MACALAILALEGEAGRAAPNRARLFDLLSASVGARPDTTSERYIEFQTLILESKQDLPWLTLPDKPQRKGRTAQRDEHASLIKDVIAFQEELWQKQQKANVASEPSPSAGMTTPSPMASLQLQLEPSAGDEDEESDVEEESFGLAISPVPTVLSISTVVSDSTVSAGSSTLLGPNSEDSRAFKRRRVDEPLPPVVAVPEEPRLATKRRNGACDRPLYAQRPSRKMRRDTQVGKAAATLLGGFVPATDSVRPVGLFKSEIGGEENILRSHVMATGVGDFEDNYGGATRLSALAALVGESNIEDEQLFDAGELESLLRTEEEVGLLRKVWEKAELEEEAKTNAPDGRPEMPKSKRIDAAVFEQTLKGLKDGIPLSSDETSQTDILDVLRDEVDGEKGDDVYHLHTMDSTEADSPHIWTSALYDPFAEFEEL